MTITIISSIRYIPKPPSLKSATALLHLNCHIKPGASKQREGIVSVSDSVIEICVSAPAREGEANLAVREVFRKALKCPMSDIQIVRGLKSRDKVVAITVDSMAIDSKTEGAGYIQKVRDILMSSIA